MKSGESATSLKYGFESYWSGTRLTQAYLLGSIQYRSGSV